MKEGSLVECVESPIPSNYGETMPVVGEIYTVREIYSDGKDTAIRLVEIHNPVREYADGFIEVSFWVECFRELQPPMDLSELMEGVVTIHNT